MLVKWQKLFHILLSIAENINLFADTVIDIDWNIQEDPW